MIVFIWIIGTRDVRSAPPRWKMGCPAPQKLKKLIEKADSLFHRVCPHFEKKGRAFPFWILYSPRIPDEKYHLRCFYSVLKMSIYPTALAQTFYLYVVLITGLVTIKYWQLQGGLENLHWRFLTSISRLSHTLPADAFYFLGENVAFHHTQLPDFNDCGNGGLGAAIDS